MKCMLVCTLFVNSLLCWDESEKWLQTMQGGEGTSWVARDHATVSDSKQLWESFVHFFRRGSATERFVSDAALFDELIDRSEQFVMERQNQHGGYHIGGNAALMATKFASEGWDVLLGGALGPKLRELMVGKDLAAVANDASVHPSLNDRRRGTIHFARGADGEQSSVDRDEVHLILEYTKGSKLQYGYAGAAVSAPRANRYIATRDYINGNFLSLVPLHDEIERFKPHLLVVSGFHLMDSEPDAERRRDTLMRIKTQLANETSRSIRFIHLELASMGNRDRYREVAETLFPHITSLGLNEQELLYMYEMLTDGAAVAAAAAVEHPVLDQIAQPRPNIEHVRKALSLIMQHYPALQRIHFHSLAFHSVVHRFTGDDVDDDDDKLPLANRTIVAKAAVAGSSLAATQRACGLDSVTHIASIVDEGLDILFNVPQETRQFIALHRGNAAISVDPNTAQKGIMSWSQSNDGLEFFTVPVLVCTRVVKTVGLGDVISSAGLVHQLEALRYEAPHLF